MRARDEAAQAPDRITRHRVARVRALLQQADLAAVLLYSPVNIRYVTGTRNMQVWHLHNFLRHALVINGGPVVLYEYPGARHVLDAPGVRVDEVRSPQIYSFMWATDEVERLSRSWAAEIDALLREHAGGNRRLAVDRIEPAGLLALTREGLQIEDGQALLERARCIKSADEIAGIRGAIEATEAAIGAMRAALRPGISEQALWSQFHQKGIELGGEWVDTRLLASGSRTNPWFQECGERLIEDGELVAFDTDFVGPGGYYVDISRTWRCGEGRPTDAQRRLYADAYAALQRQIELLRPGLSLREYAERVGAVPEPYAARRYTLLAHGLGLVEEYPVVPFQQDLASCPAIGRLEPGMTLCVEFYAGLESGGEGVKLEEQILITEHGTERLSHYPCETSWL